MLVKRSLQAGLITGLAMILLALVFTFWWAQLRLVWPAVFAPVFFTGVCAVLHGGRTVTTARAALLAGAVAGLATAALSAFGVSLTAIIQAAIPNWPYPGSPTRPGTFALAGILADSPFYVPRDRLWLDLPLTLPFPWPWARTLPNGVAVSRLPMPWVYSFRSVSLGRRSRPGFITQSPDSSSSAGKWWCAWRDIGLAFRASCSSALLCLAC